MHHSPESPLIRLRPLTLGDLDAIMAWINDPDVVRNFARLSGPITREEEERFLTATLGSETDRLWAIERDDGKYLGNAGIHKIWWPSKNGRLGLVVGDKSAHGRGVGTEAMRLLCEKGFEELGLHKLWLMRFADNHRMGRIAEKLGFVAEGVLRDEYFHAGVYHDMVRYSLLEPEWRRARLG